MQTRRDQLQAYRFQNRRALAALVTGEPNVLEAPMRRLTVTTISGIMIAVLIACVFAVIGFFKPSTGDAWRAAGAIIVVRDTPTIYVLLNDNELHPVVNYASAVLAVGDKASPHVVEVDNSDLGSTPRGSTIGINYLPNTFPSAGSLVRSTWTVCSRLRTGEANDLQARVDVYAGSTAAASPLPSDQAVLAQSVDGSSKYILVDGMRYPLGSDRAQVYLMLQNTSPVTVGTAFLNAIPAGPVLSPPTVDGLGGQISAYTVNGAYPHIGEVLDVQDGNAHLVALSDGVAAVTPLQAELLQAESQPNGQPVGTVQITKSEEASLIVHQSKAPWNKINAEFGAIPDALPKLATGPATNGGLCVEYRNGSMHPIFATPPSQLPTYPGTSVTESAQSSHGVADEVAITAGSAALVQFAGQTKTVFFVAGPGRKFSAASTAALRGFGYANVKPTQLPVQLEPLIPDGPAFDAAAALKAPTG